MAEHTWTADLEGTSDRELVLREAKTEWPKTMEELNKFISETISGTHSYGSVVEAIGLIATAAMNYAGSELEVSGYQMSAADMVVLRRNRLIDSPFCILKLEEVFYPQYDIFTKLTGFVSDCGEWISKEAEKKLEDKTQASPNVIKRWQELADCKGDGDAILHVIGVEDVETEQHECQCEGHCHGSSSEADSH